MGKCFSMPEYQLVNTDLDIEIIETRLNNLERRVDDLTSLDRNKIEYSKNI